MTCRWSIAPEQRLLAERLASQLNCSGLLMQCALNRGLSEPAPIEAFLEPRLRQLSDPFVLPNMDRAVERLCQARERGETLVIFGDYDVDGVSSTALLVEVLGYFGWKVNYYLPHRLDEGYGLSQDGVENCLKKFPTSLLLAVDCGSTAATTIDWLNRNRVDVLVLDHHQVSSPPPCARALVNPQLAAADRPGLRELCSVGLAFKLAHALVKRGRQIGWPEAQVFDLRPLLDLVALGTIADQVPLIGENRILVAAGLGRLDITERSGLVALKSLAQIDDPIGVFEVGFQLAPRLNAAGRLENAEHALDLLLARDSAKAEDLARQLDARNRERQQIERSIVDEVLGVVRSKFDPRSDYVIVEGGLLWHVGVVGIVAARVLREFHRPTIIVGGEGKEWRGSGRSIDGFDLAAALRACDDLLLRHGGHAMAAGLSIAPDKIDALRHRLNELARGSLSAERLKPELKIDAEVRLSELSLERLQELRRMEPIGTGNPPVQLVTRRLRHHCPPQPLGKNQQHLKLKLSDGTAVVEAVWWNCAGKPLPGGCFDLAFGPQINAFNGRESVQLKVLDWRPA